MDEHGAAKGQMLADGSCTSSVNVIKAMCFTLGNLTASYAADVRQDVSAAISAAWLVVPAVDTGIPWDKVVEKQDVVTREALSLFDYVLGLVGLTDATSTT